MTEEEMEEYSSEELYDLLSLCELSFPEKVEIRKELDRRGYWPLIKWVGEIGKPLNGDYNYGL